MPAAVKQLACWRVTAGGAIGAGGTATMGQLNLERHSVIEGFFTQDQAGTLVINFRVAQGGPVVHTVTVPRDLTWPNFSYPFSETVVAPYVEITFTNGATPSTFHRAHAEALP